MRVPAWGGAIPDWLELGVSFGLQSMRATLVVSIDRLGVVNALVDDVREVLGLSLIAGVEYCGDEILEVESLGSLAEDSGDDCLHRDGVDVRDAANRTGV